MANIKGKYSRIKCEFPYWWRDKKEKENCCAEYWDYCYRPEKGGEACPYRKLQTVEFEANCKSYEFIEGESLRINNGREIDVDSIEYLEIDGRILINDTEDED